MITVKNKNNILKSFAILIFIVYIVGVAFFTLLWKNSGFVGSYEMNINIIPFFWLIEPLLFGKDFYLSQVALNIIMFIPLGVILPLILHSCTTKKVFFISLMVTLFIEFVQPMFARCTDIDDVLLNVLGAMLGYAILLFTVKWINRIISTLANIFILQLTLCSEQKLISVS